MRHRRPRGSLLESACHEQIKCLSNEYQVTAEHNGRSEWNATSPVSGSAYFLLQIRYREGPGHEHLPQRGLQCLTYRTVALTTATHCSHSTLNVCCSESVRCWLQATKTRKMLLFIIIIIIIIWHYGPLWVFAFSARRLHVLLALAVFFQFFIFSFFKSSMTSSCHRCLGLPPGPGPIGFQSNSFLVGLARSILCIWPSHLILCALMNLTISAPSINLSISILFHILHILSILTGPNIFLSIYLSKMHRMFSSFVVKVQLSDQ